MTSDPATVEITDDDLRRSAAGVQQFERAVGNRPAVWAALAAIADTSHGDTWTWLAAVARARRRRGELRDAARIHSVLDYCRHDQLPASTPDDWQRIGLRPCNDHDAAAIAADGFICLAALEPDTVIVKNLGGEERAIACRVAAAMTLRDVHAAGVAVLPELVELSHQALRSVGLELRTRAGGWIDQSS